MSPLLNRVARAASLAHLGQVVLVSEFLQMHLDGVAVGEQHAVQLPDVVLGGGDGLIAVEDHVHRVGIARHFLLVTAGEGLAPQAGKQLLHLRVAELGALDTGGRAAGEWSASQVRGSQ